MNELKKDFPILMKRDIAYLDSGATTQKPQYVLEKINEYYNLQNANPHRGAYSLSIEATQAYEETREKIAKFINSPSSSQIIFTKNASEALNLIAYSYGLDNLKNDDEVVISIMEHHSNLVPWQYVTKKTNSVLKYMYINEEYEITDEEIKSKITDKTKIVGITHVSNVTGTINNVKEIINYAHQKGAVVVLDASQSIPHMRVDVQDLNADFVVFSGHKMLAPLGIGVLYGKKETLENMCRHGAAVIRLDAFAYAIKKADTSCFFIEPDIWDLLYDIENIVKQNGGEILPEIHEHYTIPMKIADKGFWIYDFALPVLVLHALYNHTGKYLKNWLEKCPMKQFTTLDTHDGIGIVDVKDLLPNEEIEKVKEQMYCQGANVKKIYSSEAYNNLDIYQVNTTYYSALGNNDDAYLLARAIQFFAPGIPQVYYVGLLAGTNDIALMERTKNGRDINRHYYTMDDVKNEQERDVVKKLKELMQLRNTHPAFNLDGEIFIETNDENLVIVRSYGDDKITLQANLSNYSFKIC